MSYTTASVKVSGNNTTRDATGDDVFELFHAKQHCFVHKVYFQSLGDNAASVGRIFKNNGKDKTQGKNNSDAGEATLPLTTASETAAITPVDAPLDLYLEPGQKLLITLGTAGTHGYDVHAKVGKHYSDFYV